MINDLKQGSLNQSVDLSKSSRFKFQRNRNRNAIKFSGIQQQTMKEYEQKNSEAEKLLEEYKNNNNIDEEKLIQMISDVDLKLNELIEQKTQSYTLNYEFSEEENNLIQQRANLMKIFRFTEIGQKAEGIFKELYSIDITGKKVEQKTEKIKQGNEEIIEKLKKQNLNFNCLKCLSERSNLDSECDKLKGFRTETKSGINQESYIIKKKENRQPKIQIGLRPKAKQEKISWVERIMQEAIEQSGIQIGG